MVGRTIIVQVIMIEIRGNWLTTDGMKGSTAVAQAKGLCPSSSARSSHNKRSAEQTQPTAVRA
jgi:hypothetical protein